MSFCSFLSEFMSLRESCLCNILAYILKTGVDSFITGSILMIFLGFPLARAMKLGAVYEPEQFPAAILHFEEPKVTVLFFCLGKGCDSGSKRP